MVFQQSIEVRTAGRGTAELTAEIARVVDASKVDSGLVNIFAQHTSCSLVLTENADPSVRLDLEYLAGRWAADGDPAYRHDDEGDDDMAAHGRTAITGSSLTIPFAQGRMLLGTWQGIFLWEHRTRPHRRRCVITVLG